jgi:hypothetical protein
MRLYLSPGILQNHSVVTMCSTHTIFDCTPRLDIQVIKQSSCRKRAYRTAARSVHQATSSSHYGSPPVRSVNVSRLSRRSEDPVKGFDLQSDIFLTLYLVYKDQFHRRVY